MFERARLSELHLIGSPVRGRSGIFVRTFECRSFECRSTQLRLLGSIVKVANLYKSLSVLEKQSNSMLGVPSRTASHTQHETSIGLTNASRYGEKGYKACNIVLVLGRNMLFKFLIFDSFGGGFVTERLKAVLVPPKYLP